MEHPQTAKRRRKIHTNLNALGDVSRWRVEARDGMLCLILPEQFGGGVLLSVALPAQASMLALLAFLEDAPHATLFLSALEEDRERQIQCLEREIEVLRTRAAASDIAGAWRRG